MADRVRVAVIGCGEISDQHLAFLSTSPLVDLVAVCDLSPVAAAYAAQRFGARTSTTDHRSMLSELHPQAVHVLTPPSTHEFLTRDALAAGAHVVCEKPITPDGVRLGELQRLASEAGLHLIESQNVRFNDQVRRIEQHVANGLLGDIVHVEVSICLDIATAGKFADANIPAAGASLPGGAVHDFLPHMSYLGLHFLGYPTVARAASMWRNVSGNPQVGFDEMESLVEFSTGTTCALRFSTRERPDRFRLSVHGTAGSVETDIYQPFERVERLRGGSKLSPIVNHAANGGALVVSSVRNLRDKLMQHTPYHGLPVMLEGFYRAVVDGSVPPVTPLQVARTSALIDELTAGATR